MDEDWCSGIDSDDVDDGVWLWYITNHLKHKIICARTPTYGHTEAKRKKFIRLSSTHCRSRLNKSDIIDSELYALADLHAAKQMRFCDSENRRE